MGFETLVRRVDVRRSAIIEAQWLGVSSLSERAWSDTAVKKYFRVREHPRLMRAFSVPANVAVAPHSLSPTDGLHRLITRGMDRSRLIDENTDASPAELASLPYGPLQLGPLDGEITSVKAELFPGVVVARVTAKFEVPFDGTAPTLMRSLGALRSARTIPAVDRSMRMLTMKVRDPDATRIEQHRYEAQYFGFRVELPIGPDDFLALIPEWESDLIGCLIGGISPRLLNPDVIKKVGSASGRLNEKALHEKLLLNKQGLLYLLPRAPYEGPHTSRFDRSMDLATIAHFASAFLAHSSYLEAWPKFGNFVARRIAYWVQESALAFRASTSHRLTWEALCSALSLDHAVALLSRPIANGVDTSPPNLDAQVPENWWSVPNFREAFEQSVPISALLPSVQEQELRDFINRDRQEALRCRAAGNYRAAVVMAGAAAEGLLLGTLLSRDNSIQPTSAMTLGFQELLKKCCPGYQDDPNNKGAHNRHISAATAILLDNVVRPWRNFVHPGLALRSSQDVGRPMADAALAALDLLMDELSKPPSLAAP